MVDKTLTLRKLAELEEYLTQVSEYSKLTIVEYEKDWKTQRIIDRTLQMMIETCLDIAGHIISDERYRVPDSYADTFKVLLENDIVEESLFEVLEKMAKFRNIVVHHYDKMDSAIVVMIMTRHLGDFNRFIDSIIRFMKAYSESNSV